MTIRFFSFQRLVARLIRRRRRLVGLRTLSVCALATFMAHHAEAQTYGDSAYSSPVETGLSDASVATYEGDMPVGNAVVAETGVMVGPGGVTSTTQVPSVLGPGVGSPAAGPYVAQPYATGPFLQQQPVYQAPQSSVSDLCDPTCDLRYYVSAEALYWRRENDERFSLSQNSRLEPFDYEWGGRITVGRMLDCVNAYEVSYVGPFEWDRSTSRAGVNLQSKLNPDAPFVAADISAFNNATLHQQEYRAQLNSFEANRRWWAWDIFSTMIGVRVIDYREDYLFRSTNPLVGTGLLVDETRNIMIGPQVGADYMTPLGLRTLVGVRGKGAVVANFNRNQVFMSNAGLINLDAEDEDLDLAGLIEFGSFVKYSVTDSIRLTAGYDFWFMPGVATVPGQGLNRISPETGAEPNADEEVFIHGSSFGAEILF